MQEPATLPYLRETLLFLVLAGILIPLLQRLRVNQVLGFLAVGTVVGPFGLGLWADQIPWLQYFTIMKVAGIAPLAELGVLFLMFMIGLELSTERLWALRRWVFGAGVAQVGISTIAIGSLAYFFGNRIEVAVVLGLVLSLSSTAVAMQLMTAERTLGTPLGQASFSILMLQDLAVVPILILVGILANGAGSSKAVLSLTGLAFVKSVGSIALIYLLGRRVIRPVFRSFARQHQPDVFMALVLLSSLGIAGLTAATGLSMTLGAFLAGLLLAETEFRHEVEVTIEPFKGLLMGLFFISVGMQTDMREIVRSSLWLPLSVVGLFVIKTAVLSFIFRIGGLHWGRAVEGGLLLGQGGEFAFIVVGAALSSHLIAATVAQFIMLVVSFSLFITPLAAKGGHLFGDWWSRRHDEQSAVDDLTAVAATEGHVVIAGFGRVGQLLAQILDRQGIRYVALENDARLAAKLHMQGRPVYFGNAARAELLRKVQLGSAAAIVLTMDHPASALQAVRAVRSDYPNIPLFARSLDEEQAMALKKAGATLVIPETLESGLQLSAFVLQMLGIDDNTSARIIQREREQRIAVLESQGGA